MNLATFAVLAGAGSLLLVFGPALIGRHVTRIRHQAGLEAVAASDTRADMTADPTCVRCHSGRHLVLDCPEPPLDAVECYWWEQRNAYVHALGAHYRAAAERIGDALEVFMGGEDLLVGVTVRPAASIEVALGRLRAGIREPLSAAVTRTRVGTMEWDSRELHELLAAEDRLDLQIAGSYA